MPSQPSIIVILSEAAGSRSEAAAQSKDLLFADPSPRPYRAIKNREGHEFTRAAKRPKHSRALAPEANRRRSHR